MKTFVLLAIGVSFIVGQVQAGGSSVDPDCGYVNANGIPFGLDTCYSEYNSTTDEYESFMISCSDSASDTVKYSGWSSADCPGSADFEVEFTAADAGFTDLNCGTNNNCVAVLREYESDYTNMTGDCDTDIDSWDEYGVAVGYCISSTDFSLVLECDDDGNTVTNIYTEANCTGTVAHSQGYGDCECGESSDDDDDQPLCELVIVTQTPCGGTTTTAPTTMVPITS